MRRFRPQPVAPDAGPAGRVNSLGLRGRELVSLLDRLDFGWPTGDPSARREFVRWPFRHEFVEIRLFHPGVSVATVRAACRNLSRGGVSVLHSAYVHTGTPCEVRLPHPRDGTTGVRGRVARCHHRGGVVHEVGIAFEREVDVRVFIPHDPFGDFFALERVHPARLEGRVVVIAESADDRAAVRAALEGTPLHIREAASAGEGLEMARVGCDLVMCDLHLSDATGLDVIAAMRARGVPAPAVLLAPALGFMLRRAVGDQAVDAVLAKPVSPSLLQRAVAEFLIVRPGSGAEAARLARATDPAALEACAADLVARARELEEAARRGDALALRAACLRIAGSGPAPEFASVRVLALEAARALDRSVNPTDALEPLRALVRACRSPRIRRAA